MRRNTAEYIIYDNTARDAILAIGTMRDCARQMGKNLKTLQTMKAKANQGLIKKYTFYRMED